MIRQQGTADADQRYYSSQFGRFMTPDPSGWRSVGMGNPSSWNRYSYVLGDPANSNDPSGLLTVVIPGTSSNCGTGDFKRGSPFLQAVGGTFGETPVCFDWNLEWLPIGPVFDQAGQDLQKFVDKLIKPGEPLNIVAHSNGGNVVKSYSSSGGHYIDNLITLGTPQISGPSVNCNGVGNYINVYSSNDFVQPLQVIDYQFSILWEDFAVWIPYLDGWVQIDYWVPVALTGWLLWDNHAGRTDDRAVNIGLSSVPGISSVGHSDLHTPQVWNAMQGCLSNAGYSLSNPGSIRGNCPQ